MFYGQAVTWYGCHIDNWCEQPALGNTTDDVLAKFRLDFDGVVEAGKGVCSRSGIDCFFATNGFGSTPSIVGTRMIEAMYDKTAPYDWAKLIDYNGFLQRDEVVRGHMTPSMFLPALTMMWNTVCDGPSHGCPQAIRTSPLCWAACREREEDEVLGCSNCKEDDWACFAQLQCDCEVLDPVPWEIATSVASDDGASTCSTNVPCRRVWCGTVKQGRIVGIALFFAGLVIILTANWRARWKMNERVAADKAEPSSNVADGAAEASGAKEPVPESAGYNRGVDHDEVEYCDDDDVEYYVDEEGSDDGMPFKMDRFLASTLTHDVDVDVENQPSVAPSAPAPAPSTVVVSTETKPPAAQKDHLHALGVARLLASIHIVLGHLYAKGATAQVYFFGWGYTWVPWFFMLSGFVLAHARLNSRDPNKIDGPYKHIAKRLSTIFPMYAFGVFLAMLIRILRNQKLPGYDVLVPQSFLMQSWVPLWTEQALLSHCWFLSNMVVYWIVFGPVYKLIRNLSLAWAFASLSVISFLPWLLVIVPAASDDIEANWYKDHRWGSTDTANDIWTIMLKYNPIFYFHVFLFGMLLSLLRHRVKAAADDATDLLATFCARLMRFGAMFGYLGLILVFSVEDLQPNGYKLSARLSVLLPLQGLVLLGLSPLPRWNRPCQKDPLGSET